MPTRWADWTEEVAARQPLPLTRTRARVVANWILHFFGGDDFIRIGFLTGRKSETSSFEETRDYLSEEEIAKRAATAAS